MINSANNIVTIIINTIIDIIIPFIINIFIVISININSFNIFINIINVFIKNIIIIITACSFLILRYYFSDIFHGKIIKNFKETQLWAALKARTEVLEQINSEQRCFKDLIFSALISAAPEQVKNSGD